ncbi:MAG: sugar phosphate isomerase/epimerase [Planctomycetota bacterium]
MNRPVTLFTGQWADLPLSDLAPLAQSLGFDGLELACWGDHLHADRAATDSAELERVRGVLDEHGLVCHAISNHLVGQAVCDPIDHRHKAILPAGVWGDGEPEGVRNRAAEAMKTTARAARALDIDVVNGFTGSAVWHALYAFPPTSQADIDAGFSDFAARWNPILDVFDDIGVRFALEVHPTEIAYDIPTAERAIEAVGGRTAFGFNFDPSHLLWQGVNPVAFIEAFPDRIYHVHMKDVAVKPQQSASILGSHLAFGDARRAWDFRSVGRGDVDFDGIIRALNRTGYVGPLSVEWEDPDMDREHGARESAEYVRSIDFRPAGRAFDAAFDAEAQP